MEQVYHSAEELVGRYLSRDLINEQTGLVLAEAGDESHRRGDAQARRGRDRDHPDPRHRPPHRSGPDIRNTMALADRLPEPRGGAARHLPRACARASRRRAMRPRRCSTACSSIPSATTCRAVGRMKFNMRLGLETEDTLRRAAHARTSSRSSRCWSNLNNGNGEIDDIDHLGNRRVRSVGELAGEPVPRRAACASSARSRSA